MKPNSFYSFANMILLVCLVFVLSSFGQIADNKTPNENKVSQIQTSADTTPKNTDNKPNEQRYRIGYQDTIEVVVFKHPELSGNYSINPDGTIFLPRLDAPVIAICKTELELKEDITA